MKAQSAGPQPEFQLRRSGLGRMTICNKFPGEADGSILEEPPALAHATAFSIDQNCSILDQSSLFKGSPGETT